VANGFSRCEVKLGKRFLRLRNMLLKTTFPISYLGLVEATLAALKKWLFFGTASYEFMSVKSTPLPQQYIIYSTPFRRTVHACSPSKCCDHTSQKQAQTLKQHSAWQTPSNCRHFHDYLFQIQFSDCSALPESRLQSLPHPYSPLRALPFSELAKTRSGQIIHI